MTAIHMTWPIRGRIRSPLEVRTLNLRDLIDTGIVPSPKPILNCGGADRGGSGWKTEGLGPVRETIWRNEPKFSGVWVPTVVR